MKSRIEREREYHNEAFSNNVRKDLDKYYAIFEEPRQKYKDEITPKSPDENILEYGCGIGGMTEVIAQDGGNVVSIDISDWAIEHAKEEALKKGLKNVEYKVMNAESLEFADSSFSIICGAGILHHLDLEKSYSEIARVLKENGKGVFLEPLGHNPVINLYRLFTPKLRTEDEHPLKKKDLKLLKKYFDNVEIQYYFIFSILASFFYKTKIFKGLLRFLKGCDRLFFTIMPFSKIWAWHVLIIVKTPKKN